MSVRLPTPGGDDGQWGQLLNDFLDVAHNANGTLQTSAITTAGGYVKPGGGIPSSDLSSAVQTTLSNVGNATKLQGTNVDGSAPSDGEALVYSQTAGAWVPNTITSGGAVADATTGSKGIVQLAGDLGGTASSPTVPGLANKAAKGANSDITSLTGLTTPLTTTQGGTGNNSGKALVDVAAGGTTIGTRSKINFIQGSNVTLTTADNSANGRVDVTIAASSGGGGGGYSFNFVSKTANYTAANLDYVLVDSTSGAVTITLPAAAANAFVRVKRMNASGNGVSVASPNNHFDVTVSGTDTLPTQYQSQDYLSDGTNWYRV